MVDRAGIGYAFRIERVAWMFKLWDGKRTFMQVLNSEFAEFMLRCGDNSQTAIDHNHRGDHFASVAGVDRQSKVVC